MLGWCEAIARNPHRIHRKNYANFTTIGKLSSFGNLLWLHTLFYPKCVALGKLLNLSEAHILQGNMEIIIIFIS